MPTAVASPASPLARHSCTHMCGFRREGYVIHLGHAPRCEIISASMHQPNSALRCSHSYARGHNEGYLAQPPCTAIPDARTYHHAGFQPVPMRFEFRSAEALGDSLADLSEYEVRFPSIHPNSLHNTSFSSLFQIPVLSTIFNSKSL